MTEIFLFKPEKTLVAENNLKNFIARTKSDLAVFGRNLDWEAPVWPKVAVFSKLGVTTRKPAHNELLDPEYSEFARAYFRYQQGHNPTGSRHELKALKAVEAALIQVTKKADISYLSIPVLDQAAVLTREHYSSGAAYQCGREIKRLAEFVNENNLIEYSLNGWRNPIRRPGDKNKTGREGRTEREKKLPNETASNALAEIFSHDPQEPRDSFTVSVYAMLMCAPSRISEILSLPVDCGHFGKDQAGNERYGWRFYSAKGFEGDIKWIPSVMVTLAQEAVKRLTALSESSRNLAKWIEENPNDFYRHQNCPNVPNNHPLTIKQACMALGLAHGTRRECTSSLFNRGLVTKDGAHTLNSLWQHTMQRLPNDFPWYDKARGIKYSEALCLLNKNQLHGAKATLPVEFYKPITDVFNNDLSPRESIGAGAHHSIFDRYGYRSESGARLKITSHQVRHLLNTIAQRGGLSNLEIAKWSGRADIKQNNTYNHMSEYEILAKVDALDPSRSLFGPAGEVSKFPPVTVQEFNSLEHAAAHVTEYGFCIHDYIMSPCEKYRDCINCTEQVCIKGNSDSLDRIKARLERVDRLFTMATEAINSGEMGADRWYQHHEKTLLRLRDLVSILESPEIEDGAAVRLKGTDFTQLRRVTQKKISEVIFGGLDHQKSVEDLNSDVGS